MLEFYRLGDLGRRVVATGAGGVVKAGGALAGNHRDKLGRRRHVGRVAQGQGLRVLGQRDGVPGRARGGLVEVNSGGPA